MSSPDIPQHGNADWISSDVDRNNCSRDDVLRLDDTRVDTEVRSTWERLQDELFSEM